MWVLIWAGMAPFTSTLVRGLLCSEGYEVAWAKGRLAITALLTGGVQDLCAPAPQNLVIVAPLPQSPCLLSCRQLCWNLLTTGQPCVSWAGGRGGAGLSFVLMMLSPAKAMVLNWGQFRPSGTSATSGDDSVVKTEWVLLASSQRAKAVVPQPMKHSASPQTKNCPS